MIKTILIAAALAAFGATAVADTPEKKYQVRYNPVELTTEAGLQNVLGRIEDAAVRICKSEYGGSRWVSQRREYKQCLKDVTDEFLEKVGSERLQALHDGDRAPVRLVQRPPYH